MQPCWTCVNYNGGCPWSARFQPVPGWDAEPVQKSASNTNPPLDTYDIKSCPMYVSDGSRDPEERGRKQTINKNHLGRYSLSPEEDRIRMDLYYRGLTDLEIAETLEVSREAIRNWRRRRKLEANNKK